MHILDRGVGRRWISISGLNSTQTPGEIPKEKLQLVGRVVIWAWVHQATPLVATWFAHECSPIFAACDTLIRRHLDLTATSRPGGQGSWVATRRGPLKANVLSNRHCPWRSGTPGGVAAACAKDSMIS